MGWSARTAGAPGHSRGVGAPFALPLPSDSSLVGLSLCTQGAGIDGALTIALTIALDITLGSY